MKHAMAQFDIASPFSLSYVAPLLTWTLALPTQFRLDQGRPLSLPEVAGNVCAPLPISGRNQ